VGQPLRDAPQELSVNPREKIKARNKNFFFMILRVRKKEILVLYMPGRTTATPAA
jgi:hypothetical protein